MGKKSKKPSRRMPPLSLGDKLIYWVLFLLLFASYFLLFIGQLFLRRSIAFSDEAVIASAEHASSLWYLLPLILYLCITLGLWDTLYMGRRPLFGRRNFKYGPPTWANVYPLFMKNKPYVYISEAKKKEKKLMRNLVLIVLVIGFIPFPWSLFGRDCLLYDGSIKQYSMFNNQTNTLEVEDITDIEISTIRSRNSRKLLSHTWSVQMVFTTADGEAYTFRSRDFRRGGQSNGISWPEAMLHTTKHFPPEIIHCSGKDDLRWVFDDHDFSPEEAQMLHQLFER